MGLIIWVILEGKHKMAGKTTKDIFFKLDGVGINPKTFSAHEVAAIISNLEDTLRIVTKSKSPELDEAFLYISLVEVTHQSAGFKFRVSIPQIGAAFLLVASSVGKADYSKLPPRAVVGLKEIQKVIAHRECRGSFIAGRKTISEINKSTEIEVPTIGNITGETVLFGEIQRVGGAEPKIVLRLTNGDLFSLDVSREIARSLSPRLYTQVGLRGIATWSYSDNKLLTFQVESLTEYEDTPIGEAFEQLRGVIGKYWDEIEDVEDALYIS